MRRSMKCAVTLAAVVTLAGCNGAAPMTPARGNALTPSSSWVVRPASRGFTESHRRKNVENLAGGGGGARYSCTIVLTVSGNAVGPYRGTFTGGGSFDVCSRPGFSGSFALTSGSNHITGSFNGSGQGGCGRSGCVDEGKLTYEATLQPGGKTFAGNGKGALRLFGSRAATQLTLHSM